MAGRATSLTWAGLREAGTNLSAAALYALFAASHAQAYLLRPRASLLLVVALEGLVAVLLLLRTPAERASLDLGAWVTTMGGTLAPLFLRPGAEAGDLLLGQALQWLGLLLAVYSVLSLRRSFGLLPAVRGVRVAGAYRFVRHPIYAAYTVHNLGYLLNNQTLTNLLVVAAALLFQVLRIFNEERLLLGVPAYREYAARTRWRLLPRIF